MNLEGFSKKGMELGNNHEGIKETENDVMKNYMSTVRMYALNKMRNGTVPEFLITMAAEKYSSQGLNVTKESLLEDIEREIRRQRIENEFSFDSPSIDKIPKKKSDEELEAIKNIGELKKELFDKLKEEAPVFEQNQNNFSVTSKPIEDLQLILSTYQDQNMNEDEMTSGRHR